MSDTSEMVLLAGGFTDLPTFKCAGLICPELLWGLRGSKLYKYVFVMFSFRTIPLSKSQWIFTNFDMPIDIVEICFWIAHWQISSIFDRVIYLGHDNGGVLSFHVLLSHLTSGAMERTLTFSVLC